MASDIVSVRVRLASGLVSNRLAERRGDALIDADGSTIAKYETMRPATAREAWDWWEDQNEQALAALTMQVAA